MNQIAISPCSNPELELEPALREYAALGYQQFEGFSSWARSALDYRRDPAAYASLATWYGMRFSSYHLPPVTEDVEASLQEAIAAARFAKELGASVVLFKAKTRPLYVAAAKPFLDATADLGITPVLQNHAGTAISTLADFREVIADIGDSRMKTLLEVGHFHSVGVGWRDGCELLGASIALVHIKDQIGAQSVPFGTGEIDLPGLFAHLRSVDYRGNIVVEMEVKDTENTLRYLAGAHDYLRRYWAKPGA